MSNNRYIIQLQNIVIIESLLLSAILVKAGEKFTTGAVGRNFSSY